MNASNPSVGATNRVLVGVDGSPASLEALRKGAEMAALLGDQLVALTAWQPFRHGLLPPNSTHPQATAEQLVAKSILEAFRGKPAPTVTIVAAEGVAAEVLVPLSRDASMLVVGSRGHAGLTGVMLGSVSAACAAHAACPVLVVHVPVIDPRPSVIAETVKATMADAARTPVGTGALS